MKSSSVRRLSHICCGLGLALGLGLGPVAAVLPVPVLQEQLALAQTYDVNNPYVVSDTSQTTTNPFPDKVGDAFIASVTQPEQPSDMSLIHYQYLELTDGTYVLGLPHNEMGLSRDFDLSNLPQQYAGKIKALHTYMVIPKTSVIRSNTYNVGGYYTLDWKGNTSSFNPAVVGATLEVLPITSLKLNGVTIDEKPQYINFKTLEHTQYIEVVWELPQNFLSTCIQSYSHASLAGFSPTSPQTSNSSYPSRSTLYTTADFHFVDDLSYRKNKKLGLTADIVQRSADTPNFSNAAMSKLPLKDLTAPYHVGGKARPVSSDEGVGIQAAPLLFSETESGFNKNLDLQNNQIVPKEEKKTYQALIATQLAGYVYIADDIDKAPNPGSANAEKSYTAEGIGNHYLVPARNSDGSLSSEKHYYLLYRRLPIPVNFTVTKNDLALAKCSYDLYALVDGKEVLIKKNLVSDAEGNFSPASELAPQYSDLETIAKNAANIDLDKQAYVVHKDDISDVYLMPGNYRLKPSEGNTETLAKDLDFEVKEIEVKEGQVVPQHFDIKLKEETKPAAKPDSKASATKASLPKTSDPFAISAGLGLSSLGLFGLACMAKPKRNK